jgi:hypothetical protein
MRNDILDEAKAALTALHNPVHYGQMYGLSGERFDFMVCDECTQMCHSETGLRCEEPGDAAWPCAELARHLAAIDALKEDHNG